MDIWSSWMGKNLLSESLRWHVWENLLCVVVVSRGEADSVLSRELLVVDGHVAGPGRWILIEEDQAVTKDLESINVVGSNYHYWLITNAGGETKECFLWIDLPIIRHFELSQSNNWLTLYA